MLLKVHPDNPSSRKIEKAVDLLLNGGIIIYPTDTVYAMGCDLNHKEAVEKLMQLKGLKSGKADLSFICPDISKLADYAKIEDDAFKIIKQNTPGAFTFILPAKRKISNAFKKNRKTVGIRIPDSKIARMLSDNLGSPIISTSLHDSDAIVEYPTDPELIYDTYQKEVDAVIDGGYGDNHASTVVDLTNEAPEIIREGKGNLIL